MNKNKLIAYHGGWVLILFLLTRAIAYIILNTLPPKGAFVLSLNWGRVGLLIHYNTGVAFGLPSGGALIFGVVGILLVFIGYLFLQEIQKKHRSLFVLHSLTLVMAGGISNIVDRLLYGAVLDYIKIFWWPIFNVADIFIVVGVAGLVVHTFFYEDKLK